MPHSVYPSAMHVHVFVHIPLDLRIKIQFDLAKFLHSNPFHQFYNASMLLRQQACRIIEEKDLVSR